MPTTSVAKEALHRLYGVEFPDSLFLLHEFLSSLSAREAARSWDAMRVGPAGPLQLVELGEKKLRSLKPPALPMVLHWRFYRDVPEFFTCLHADFGRHWGLLLDEPERGFRGAASYYSPDPFSMLDYAGLFVVMLDRIEA